MTNHTLEKRLEGVDPSHKESSFELSPLVGRHKGFRSGYFAWFYDGSDKYVFEKRNL
jgi:hypothetical protein